MTFETWDANLLAGDIYEGQYQYGYKHGQGKITYHKRNIVYIGEWNKNTYNGEGKMWWYPTYEALEKEDDTHAQTYTGQWIGNKHNGEGAYYWPDKKQTFRGSLSLLKNTWHADAFRFIAPPILKLSF